MDQIRKFFGWLKRQHFWVLSAMVAAIAAYCWYSASGALQTEFTANESKIKSQFSAVESVNNQPFIANEIINEEQSKEIAKHASAVTDIWEQLFERQSERVLKWPDELSQRFRDEVAELKFEDEIPRPLREEYLNYIDSHFEALPNKIGARVMPAGEGGMSQMGGYGRGMERGYSEMSYGQSPDGLPEDDEDDYLVAWLDQQRVRAELNFGQTPSALQIWVTQENLWVYHTLLDIIANTNQAAGADRKSNAAVRIIHMLEIGKLAAQASAAKDRIWKPPTAAPIGGEMGMGMERGMEAGAVPMDGAYPGGEMMGRGGEMGYGMEGLGEAAGSEQGRAVLLSGRYLGADGLPISVTSPTPSGDLGDKEYKRLPIRMTLQADLRWLSFLIAECANQPLQVEVQEVRINPPDAGTMGGGYGGGESYRGGGGGSGAESPFTNSPGRNGEVISFEAQPHIGTVVIQGTIYIFNEPDPAALQPAQGTETVALTQ